MLKSKDILGLREMPAEEIDEILDVGMSMKKLLKQNIKKLPHLQGKSVTTLFYENSTRTRCSFELAAKYMGAHVVNISADSSSVKKGETLVDTGKTLDAMKNDIIVIRHPMGGAPALLGRTVKAHVVNAGDGMNEHPSQALLDMLTMRENFGSIEGLKVAILGDISHSRVAKSNLFGLKKLGAEVTMYAPKTLIPTGIERMGAKICRSREEAVEGADVVMGLRIQLERQHAGNFPSLGEYSKFYRQRGAHEVREAECPRHAPRPRQPRCGADERAHRRRDEPHRRTGALGHRGENGHALFAHQGGDMIFRNATCILPGGVRRTDIRVEEGRITEIAEHLEGEGVDWSGLTVFPGLIDMHVHLREPGFERKEDIESGSRAAVKGGFTQICCMPNTNPVTDSKVVVIYILSRARDVDLCKVRPIGAITKGQEGKELAAIGGMKAAGAVALSEDGKSVVSTGLMANAMKYASDFGLICLCHCEDKSLVDGGVVNEGYYSTLTGLKGSIRAAEDIIIAREICLSESLDIPVHICHVSTYSGVQLIREAKARGVKVTAETCPHYFTLTDEVISSFDTNTKVNPPIREERDRLAVIEGLKDGTLDCIVTDHAPHHADDKNVEYDQAAFGISGLETSFALSYTALVKGGALSLEELAKKMSSNPARILNLEGGVLEVGAPADFTAVDLGEKWTIDPKDFVSKGKNTPFTGREVYGRVKYTVVDGNIKYSEERK